MRKDRTAEMTRRGGVWFRTAWVTADGRVNRDGPWRKLATAVEHYAGRRAGPKWSTFPEPAWIERYERGKWRVCNVSTGEPALTYNEWVATGAAS